MYKLTLSTCWYVLKAKFDVSTYQVWIDNMLSNVVNYNLVIYSDENSVKYIEKYSSENIKIVIKPIEEFYNYKYKDKWIENHKVNHALRDKVGWEVNMLWSEKVHFVNETVNNRYFITDYYGWCDIGYFRNNVNDSKKEDLKYWPSDEQLKNFSNDKIYYGCVNNDDNYVNMIATMVNNKNIHGLPEVQLPPHMVMIAGGFFIAHRLMVGCWARMYDEKLNLYFNNNYLVKDDQMIITDCIYSMPVEHFVVCKENNKRYNNWFMFQRLLL